MNPLIIGIRFQKVGKIYHFDASSCRAIQPGDYAVVETSRGRQLGEVVQIIHEPVPPPEGSWKLIQRKATPQDLVLRQTWHKKEIEAMINCRAKSSEMKIPGVKIVAAEYSFDGARLSLLYSTETEEKVDLRNLRRAMQRIYPQTQVELHQIGPRDVAKVLGGMGACGLENRCCSMFLTEFSPVSIKMAKEQGISLTPTEITGMCGRLRCCLVYEYEQYVEARKNLPKRGKRVVTANGEGKVVDVYPLKGAVMVEFETGAQKEFTREEIQPADELEALKQKAQAPCDRHENGGCTCGKDRQSQADASETLERGEGQAGTPAGEPSETTGEAASELPAQPAEPQRKPDGYPGQGRPQDQNRFQDRNRPQDINRHGKNRPDHGYGSQDRTDRDRNQDKRGGQKPYRPEQGSRPQPDQPPEGLAPEEPPARDEKFDEGENT